MQSTALDFKKVEWTPSHVDSDTWLIKSFGFDSIRSLISREDNILWNRDVSFFVTKKDNEIV